MALEFPKEFDVIEASAGLHERLMQTSPVYRYAVENQLAGLVTRLMLWELESVEASDGGNTGKTSGSFGSLGLGR
jgi:hypothetical protein